MVNKNDILRLIQNPNSITQQDITELKELQKNYPFFNTINLLLTKGLHKFESLQYHKQLKQTAIAIPDREILYKLIYKQAVQEKIQEIESNTQPQPEKPKTEEKQINSLEDIAGARKNEQDKLEELILSHAVASASYNIEKNIPEEQTKTVKEEKTTETKPSLPDNFYEWLSPTNVTPKQPEPSIDKLVDKFLHDKKNERISKKEFFSPTNMAKISVVDQNSFVTETLANIYFQQKKYDKALDAYEKLILKIPEKKPFFVSQIEKIKTILNT